MGLRDLVRNVGDPKADLPRLSAVEREIIRLLVQQGESYGLQLVEDADGSVKRGTVYVTLGRMQDKGYVESRTERPDPHRSGIPRRLYKATGYGARVLKAWEIATAGFNGEPA